MGVEERLSLEAVSAHTLIAFEHVHRYELAARLCEGMRVLDLACGSGYGSRIVRTRAVSVLGVDNDAETIHTARATIGREDDVEFEVADALKILRRELSDSFDAIVCFEGLEHFADLEEALGSLAHHARSGLKLVVSVPNSKAIDERNEFHVTDFGYEETLAAFARFDDLTLLYQYLAEGSLIRGEEAEELDSELGLPEQGEKEYANHFIACVNFGSSPVLQRASTHLHLAVAPNHNRYMRSLERANRELWRTNSALARQKLGASDSAAVSIINKIRTDAEAKALAKVPPGPSPDVQAMQARIEELERAAAIVQSWYDAPRYRAVDAIRNATRRIPGLYPLVRAIWRLFGRRWK